MAEKPSQSSDKVSKDDDVEEKVEFRQFACDSCHRSWWKRVRAKKPVSQCRNCKTKYDALPRDKEFGVAEFVCPKCGHTFTGRGQVTTTSICYKCKTQCEVNRIVPEQGGVRRKKRRKHSRNEDRGQGVSPSLGSVVHSDEVPDSTASSIMGSEYEMRLPIDISGTDDSSEEEEEEEIKEALATSTTAKKVPLTMENLSIHDDLVGEGRLYDEELEVEVEFRQFGCRRCYRSWWKRVRVRKPVSKCKSCRIKYDALPKDKEYGVAEFLCPNCRHTFLGRGRVTTTSPCNKCDAQCEVIGIVIDTKDARRRSKIAEFVCSTCGKTFRGRGRVRTTSTCYRCNTVCEMISGVVGQGGEGLGLSQSSTGQSEVGQFACPTCGHTFAARGEVTTVGLCHQCNTECGMSRSVAARDKHYCNDCLGVGRCPNFKPVIHFSKRHNSTGSTASSLTKREFEVRLPLKALSTEPSIQEEDSGDDNDMFGTP